MGRTNELKRQMRCPAGGGRTWATTWQIKRYFFNPLLQLLRTRDKKLYKGWLLPNRWLRTAENVAWTSYYNSMFRYNYFLQMRVSSCDQCMDWFLTTVCFFSFFSSVTACSPQLEWVAWLTMRPQYQPARQKCLLPLNKFTTVDILLPDVFWILNVCLENGNKQMDTRECNKWTII